MPAPTVSDLIVLFSTRIPFEKAASWDVSGLHIGDGSLPVRRVGICHEVTESVVAQIETDPVDMLVTYHPLVFRPTTRIMAGTTPVGRAHRLIRAGVSVVVAHTAFDVARGGTSDALAAALGLGDVVPFGVAEPIDQVKIVTFAPAEEIDRLVDSMAAAGGGSIGNYGACHFRVDGVGGFDAMDGARPVVGGRGRNREPEVRLEMIAPAARRDRVVGALVAAHPYEEPAFDVYAVRSNDGFIGRLGGWSGTLGGLADLAAERLATEGLRISGDRAREIGTVAVVPGSGSSFVGAAVDAGADVIVTGDVGHHSVVEALDRGMAVVDPGHAPTERPGMGALVRLVRELVASSVEVTDLTDLDPTPWR